MGIPRLDLAALRAQDPQTMADMDVAARDVGFAVVYNTAIPAAHVARVIEMYRAFFHLPAAQKERVNMAQTGANRGWGAPGSEQVDPNANPDYKQYFDSGHSLAKGDPLAQMSVYAPNLWPDVPEGFEAEISAYYTAALSVAMSVLRGVAQATGRDGDAFEDAFQTPMALLRGNFYPERPSWAGAKDFGIATHTDYGCVTLLATDGSPGLEVRTRGGGWIPVSAPPGEFIVNFGEMLEFWTGGDVVATPHRVVGTTAERISVPLFFNPSHDTNVAPQGSDDVILAGDHMAKRFAQTYAHLSEERDG